MLSLTACMRGCSFGKCDSSAIVELMAQCRFFGWCCLTAKEICEGFNWSRYQLRASSSCASTCSMGNALSASCRRSSLKSAQLKFFLPPGFKFFSLAQIALAKLSSWSRCKTPGSHALTGQMPYDPFLSILLPARVKFSPSLHLFTAVTVSKWLIQFSKFPSPVNISGNTTGCVGCCSSPSQDILYIGAL